MNELAIAVPTSSAKTRIIIAYANEPNYVKHYEPRRRVLTYANDQLYGHCVTQWTWKTYNNIGHRHARWMTRRWHLFRKNMRMSGAPNLNARHYFIYRTVMFGPHRAPHLVYNFLSYLIVMSEMHWRTRVCFLIYFASYYNTLCITSYLHKSANQHSKYQITELTIAILSSLNVPAW